MPSTLGATPPLDGTAGIAIVGGGPAALVAAIGLARQGIRSSVFERDMHPAIAPRFNPDRSSTIDISGHGLKALRHTDVCSYFDDWMIRFKGLQVPGGGTKEWTLMSVRSLFENRFHMLHANLTSRLGLSVFDQAKSVDVPYSEVRRQAERLWPLWA
jgi:2-polyprenyl-6-methoxyphenol hydroxylase-like FAD-dependent oxidoreductase